MKIEQADALLEEWYDWSQQWRPHLGMPSTAPYCREVQPDEEAEENDGELSEWAFNRTVMETVDYCINSLPPDYSRAIGLEMRKRRGALREWRSGCTGVSYKKAVMALLPKMVERYLI